MTQQLLDREKVGPVAESQCGERMSRDVERDVLALDFGLIGPLPYLAVVPFLARGEVVEHLLGVVIAEELRGILTDGDLHEFAGLVLP